MMEDDPIAIVGGGPAGLSAALTLARADRRSIVFDAPAPPRNAAASSIGNLPGHDGTAPKDLRRRICAELTDYGSTDFHDVEISSVNGTAKEGFTLVQSDGRSLAASRVILACGRVDIYPEVEGFTDYWCKSVHNCPYCGGYADRGTPWGIVINRPEMIDIVEIYRMWSEDLVLFLEPGISIDPARKDDLATKGISVEASPIRRILGDGIRMHAVELADGRTVARTALNWWPKMRVPDLVTNMALTLTDRGDVSVDEGFHTSRAGIYAAGDLIYTDHQTVATAIHLGGACAASVVFDLAMAG
ncbi:MAG: NAD(P)/FAD-dependent oxidoreductase [Minwuiales bacterium]|nr:NAD(P)/FAD-dependent oxidoreductase [Minwuiales bacterium]